jgi:hypothetical protein
MKLKSLWFLKNSLLINRNFIFFVFQLLGFREERERVVGFWLKREKIDVGTNSDHEKIWS